MRVTSFGHAAMLVDTGYERILVDPWLTQRLDRFWEHWPAISDDLLTPLDEGVDHIVFSHHHFDHHHFPSLALLAERHAVDFDEAPGVPDDLGCVFPAGAVPPRFGASGLGHQAIAWTLRRLGFPRFSGVRPGETLRLGETTIRTLPSKVAFPEMSLLVQAPDATALICGDSILHPATREFFRSGQAPAVDVAFIPAHSVAPPGVLTQRRQIEDPGGVRARAISNFDDYVTTVNAGMTVPSSFGWRVSATGGGDFSWCNSAIFPFHPVQALGRLAELGRPGLLWGAGDVMTVRAGEVSIESSASSVSGAGSGERYDFAAIYREVELDPSVVVPPFDPAADRAGEQRDTTGALVSALLDELVGTEFWYDALDTGTQQLLQVVEDSGAEHSFLLDPGGNRIRHTTGPAGQPGGQGAEGGAAASRYGHTRISGSTLQALHDAELLFGSSYGLWTSESSLLSAVFHHPRYYTRHVEKVLASRTAGTDGRQAG